MSSEQKVNILLVDDQPAKLTSYEVILAGLGQNLLKASNAREALEILLKKDVAVLLVDVCMPDLDGFQLASMVRDHPRFESTSIIFISAIQFSDADRLRGYEMGGVDYVPVPIVPEVLRAKVKVFVDLYRNAKQLHELNRELESRVVERTRDLEKSRGQLLESEQLRSLALAAGQMGSWNFNFDTREMHWDEGQHNIFGVVSGEFQPTMEAIQALVHPEDWTAISRAFRHVAREKVPQRIEFRVRRSDGDVRSCIGTVVASADEKGRVVRLSGVTSDVTEQKLAEERQLLLAREVDHRARNMLAVVQSILALTRASSIDAYTQAVEGRIRALSRAHLLLSESRWQGANLKRLVEEEFAPYRTGDSTKIVGDGVDILLPPPTAQTIAVVLHELATNASKYGALSVVAGNVKLNWHLNDNEFSLRWVEEGGPPVKEPAKQGYGTKVITNSIQRQLNGQVQFHWLAAGLQCHLSLPFSGKEGMLNNRKAADGSPKNRKRRKNSFKGSRILLVEDEPLVSLMMEQALGNMGLAVAGPCKSAADAIGVLETTDVNGAVLDVNLNGDSSYPVADLLLARKIPFVFVTGFGKESIDTRYSAIPVLQKPIDVELLMNAFDPNASE